MLAGDQVILNNLTFSPDGRLLAAMDSNCRIVLLRTTSGAVVQSLGPGDDKMSAPPVFTPDGRIVITAVHGLVQLWEVATGGEIARAKETGPTRRCWSRPPAALACACPRRAAPGPTYCG